MLWGRGRVLDAVTASRESGEAFPLPGTFIPFETRACAPISRRLINMAIKPLMSWEGAPLLKNVRTVVTRDQRVWARPVAERRVQGGVAATHRPFGRDLWFESGSCT